MRRVAFFLFLFAGGAARCRAGECPGPDCDQQPVQAFGPEIPGLGQGPEKKKEEKKKEEGGEPPKPPSPPQNSGGSPKSNPNNNTPPKEDDKNRIAPPDLTIARPVDSDPGPYEGYDPTTGKLMCYATQVPTVGHCPE